MMTGEFPKDLVLNSLKEHSINPDRYIEIAHHEISDDYALGLYFCEMAQNVLNKSTTHKNGLMSLYICCIHLSHEETVKRFISDFSLKYKGGIDLIKEFLHHHEHQNGIPEDKIIITAEVTKLVNTVVSLASIELVEIFNLNNRLARVFSTVLMYQLTSSPEFESIENAFRSFFNLGHIKSVRLLINLSQ